MAKKDYKAMAAGIIKQAGGADNIVSATHCMTRLRLVLRDRSKFDTDAVKQVPGVLNVIIQNGEYQVVIGQDVPDLYEEVVKIDGIQAGGSVQERMTQELMETLYGAACTIRNGSVVPVL
jgi:PTS system beta-glucosides-specific IIC component